MGLGYRDLAPWKLDFAAALAPTVYLLLLFLLGGTWLHLSSSSDTLGKANSIPFLNVAKFCKQAVPIPSAPTLGDVWSCAKNEQAAERQIVRTWKRYPAPIRAACMHEIDDAAPSYLTLLTCLDSFPN